MSPFHLVFCNLELNKRKTKRKRIKSQRTHAYSSPHSLSSTPLQFKFHAYSLPSKEAYSTLYKTKQNTKKKGTKKRPLTLHLSLDIPQKDPTKTFPRLILFLPLFSFSILSQQTHINHLVNPPRSLLTLPLLFVVFTNTAPQI